MTWTVADVLARLPPSEGRPVPAPPYAPPPDAGDRTRLGLTTGANRHHMTDEAHQLFQALESAGYTLAGHDTPNPETDVREVLRRFNPGTVALQDVREWRGLTADRSQDPALCLRHVGTLACRDDMFKVTVVKDAQSSHALHRASADETRVHGWVVYYSPAVVCRLAPYIRPAHVVRTWHSVDARLVPPYRPDGRRGCLLSGAVSGAYPLRSRLFRESHQLPETVALRHPGYHRKGCATPGFLQLLSKFKVAICTASMYGFALRKLVEGTACGSAVVTDLPADEVLPGGVDENLHRVHPDASSRAVGALVRRLIREYDAERQAEYARRAVEFFDYRAAGARLAADVEALRRAYRA